MAWHDPSPTSLPSPPHCNWFVPTNPSNPKHTIYHTLSRPGCVFGIPPLTLSSFFILFHLLHFTLLSYTKCVVHSFSCSVVRSLVPGPLRSFPLGSRGVGAALLARPLTATARGRGRGVDVVFGSFVGLLVCWFGMLSSCIALIYRFCSAPYSVGMHYLSYFNDIHRHC